MYLELIEDNPHTTTTTITTTTINITTTNTTTITSSSSGMNSLKWQNFGAEMSWR